MDNQYPIDQYEVINIVYCLSYQGDLSIVIVIFNHLTKEEIEIELSFEEILPFDEMIVSEDHEFLFLN